MENIKKGFESNRTMETLKKSYQELQKHPIVAKKGKPFGDIPAKVRNGQCDDVMGEGMYLCLFDIY